MAICSVSFPVTFVRRTGRPTPSLDFEIFCRRFAAITDDFELDLLTFIEGREAGSLHRRDMNEHVLSAPLRLDEAVAFGGVEPLYISYRHLDISRTLNDVLTHAARFRPVIQGDQSAFRQPKAADCDLAANIRRPHGTKSEVHLYGPCTAMAGFAQQAEIPDACAAIRLA